MHCLIASRVSLGFSINRQISPLKRFWPIRISKRKINPSRIFVICGVWRQPILALEALRPGITGEEPGPAVGQGGTDMGNDRGLLGMGARVVLQLREKRFDLSLHVRTAGTRHAGNDGRIEPSLQLYQPAPLALEATISGSERPASPHYC